MEREPRSKKGRETECQVARPPNCQQYAYCAGQEGRPENQVSEQEAIECIEYLLNVVANRLWVERHVRQSLQLFSIEYAQIVSSFSTRERI